MTEWHSGLSIFVFYFWRNNKKLQLYTYTYYFLCCSTWYLDTLVFIILKTFLVCYSIDVAILDQDCEVEDSGGLQHDGDVEDSTDLQCASARSTTQQSAVSNSEVKTSPTKETARVVFGPYELFLG